jgi:hypothetical protein
LYTGVLAGALPLVVGIRKYLSEHPGASPRAAARDLGVSYSWVSRVRSALEAQHVADHGTKHVAFLPDGFYQIQDGRPYPIACKPDDVFHVDQDGVLQPGPRPRRRTVAQSAE